MPRTYHFCTGTRMEEYESPLEEKCDEDEKQHDELVFSVYTVIFFIFTIAVCLENIRQGTFASSRSTDNIGFIIKMTGSLFALLVSVGYDELYTKHLVTFPGNFIFYFYHLWMHPVFCFARLRRFWVDEPLCTYVRRIIRNVTPMEMIEHAPVDPNNNN